MYFVNFGETENVAVVGKQRLVRFLDKIYKSSGGYQKKKNAVYQDYPLHKQPTSFTLRGGSFYTYC